MTTPPPPPEPADWPSSEPGHTAALGGRQSWWTGGRLAVAVVAVLLLMGGAGFAGFLAGLAVGSVDSVVDGPDVTFGDDGTTVPGFTPLDSDTVAGPPVRRGGATPGVLDGVPVEHPLTVEQDGQVVLTLSSDDFDTVLVLLDEEGDLVASDDDGAGAGTDSLLDLELEAGTYTVRVQSWGSDGTGDYSLTAA